MQAQRTSEITDYPDRIAPVERVHEAAQATARASARTQAAAFTVQVADATPRSLEVRYGLDPVANVWVASFIDARTGELIKTVPATKVLHQLAELRAIRERNVDHHA